MAKLGESIISEPTFNPFEEPRNIEPESTINPKLHIDLEGKISTDVSYYKNN